MKNWKAMKLSVAGTAAATRVRRGGDLAPFSDIFRRPRVMLAETNEDFVLEDDGLGTT